MRGFGEVAILAVFFAAIVHALFVRCTPASADEAPTKLYANCEYYAPTSTTGVMVGVTVCELPGAICYSRGDGMSCEKKEVE